MEEIQPLFDMPASEQQEPKRLPDPIWDVLTECFGEVRTPLERGRRNQSVRELRVAEATPDQIRIAYDYCQRTFTTFTELAICSHFSRALFEEEKKSVRSETLPEKYARLKKEKND